MINQADVVIIGGGVNGTSLAYHLARRNYGTIVLVEKTFLGAGSSGKSGGIIRQHYSNSVMIQMAMQSRRFFETFVEEVGGHPEFVQNGFVLLARGEEAEALRANTALQRANGLEVEVMAASALAPLLPGINSAGLAYAAYEPSAGYADPNGVVAAFAERARQLGARIYQETPVTAIGVANGTVQSVTTPAGTIRTPLVVNVAGPWGNQIGAMAGITFPLTPRRLQEMVIHPPQPYPKDRPTVIDLVHGIYFRPEPGGLVLAGGGVTEERAPTDPDRYQEGADAAFIETVSEGLAARMPSFREATFRRGWSGLITLTPDFHPLLGESHTVKGFYYALGFSGHGFKLSPMIGRLMAELIMDGQASTLDITPFDAVRFVRGTPFKSRYESFPILA